MGTCCSSCMFSGDDSDNGQHNVREAGGNMHFIRTMDNWETMLSEAIKEDKLVVANFGASWCNPCITIAPVFAEVAAKHPSILFLTVDVDDLAELSNSWDIKATPTFVFLKNGRQVDTLVGGNKTELQKKIAAMSQLATMSRH
ncbi:PREDICTED: thioredoxin H9 [Fragaria vesca subsp. vesca]|uniref:thioredoxin H9 n=1 Tax=Fragaria vesca subsp. vesca TaxID=101020 RepID=UPI0002C2FE7A|nr:PREDICTED: thioredoxin H9 [Fragaria vesca subsp. vesca]